MESSTEEPQIDKCEPQTPGEPPRGYQIRTKILESDTMEEH